MDPNNMQGGVYSNVGSGMLGLEMSLHHHPQSQSQTNQNPQNPSFLAPNTHPQTSLYPQQDPNFRNTSRQFPPKSRSQTFAISDEDEPMLGAEDSEGKRKIESSPWQRMKWTDDMVRLLILVVYYIGDEVGSEGVEVAGKKKGSTSGGVILKKGKWKSVSRAMMEKGFCVSPQQCEDKFNDLNKRYKRVNDLLGKGTACRVVENQSLLDTMDNLTAKKKDEVKKLLNSKHLFFREMCAYHTSCASGGGGSGGGCASGGVPPPELPEEPVLGQKTVCRHSSENANFVAYPGRKEVEDTSMVKWASREEKMDENEEIEDDRDEHEDDEDNNDVYEECSRKRAKPGRVVNSDVLQQLGSEMASVVQDMSRSSMEKRQWVKNRMMQLEEKRVEFQFEALALEKQRLKWLKFSSKKEREMETEKIQNERARLENDRMLLLLRHKEFELLDHKQSSNISGSVV